MPGCIKTPPVKQFVVVLSCNFLPTSVVPNEKARHLLQLAVCQVNGVPLQAGLYKEAVQALLSWRRPSAAFNRYYSCTVSMFESITKADEYLASGCC